MGIEVILIWLIVGGVGVAAGTFFSIWIQIIAFVIFIYWLSTEKGGLDTVFPSIIGMIFFLGVVVGDVSYFFQTDRHKTIEVYNPFVVTNVEYDKSKIPDGVNVEDIIQKAVDKTIQKIANERDIEFTDKQIKSLNQQFKQNAINKNKKRLQQQALDKLSIEEKEALGL
jgi:hypothetical protein